MKDAQKFVLYIFYEEIFILSRSDKDKEKSF